MIGWIVACVLWVLGTVTALALLNSRPYRSSEPRSATFQVGVLLAALLWPFATLAAMVIALKKRGERRREREC